MCWISFAVLFVVVAWAAAGFAWRIMRPSYRRAELTYVVPRPSASGGGFALLGKQVGESFQRMAYGSSTEDWQRRCAASAQASRARRGLR